MQKYVAGDGCSHEGDMTPVEQAHCRLDLLESGLWVKSGDAEDAIHDALDSAEAMLDAMSRDETTTPEQMVEAVRAMKKRYQEDGA